MSKVYNIKIADNRGLARESDLLAGLSWVYENAAKHNIRVVNISCQSSLAQSYLTSPLSAAVQRLWFAGIVVVVSIGNKGSAADAVWYPPGNDPYVISVGAHSEAGTKERTDDYVPEWSSRGLTQDGFSKPDVLAPGHRIIAPLANGSRLARDLPDRVVEHSYIRLSGTSMSAAMVTGLVADLLSQRPALNPNQVKFLVSNQTAGDAKPGMLSSSEITTFLSQNQSSVPEANQGLTPNLLLQIANGVLDPNNVFFDNVFFDNVFFENVFFENVFFDNVFFENVFFDNVFFD